MMLPETSQDHSSFIDTRQFIQGGSQGGNVPAGHGGAARDFFSAAVTGRCLSFSEETPGPDDSVDADLEDAARAEREYVKERLREELQREPTEEEVDQWLREHTEGY